MHADTNNHVLSLSSWFLKEAGARGWLRGEGLKGKRTRMVFKKIKFTHHIPFLKSLQVYRQPKEPNPLERNTRAPLLSLLCFISHRMLHSSHPSLPAFLHTHSALSCQSPHHTVGFPQTLASLHSICILASLQNVSLILLSMSVC